MPRVKGDAPGYPRYLSTVQSWGRSAGVYRRRTGTPEIVVKRACPCSSRFTPVDAPIGRSGDFSSVGASVFSGHSFSTSEGRRSSKMSLMGLSATCGLDRFFSGMMTPVFCSDDREPATRWARSYSVLERPVGQKLRVIPVAFVRVPTPSHISMTRSQHDKDAAAGLLGRPEIPAGKSSCKRTSSAAVERY